MHLTYRTRVVCSHFEFISSDCGASQGGALSNIAVRQLPDSVLARAPYPI